VKRERRDPISSRAEVGCMGGRVKREIGGGTAAMDTRDLMAWMETLELKVPKERLDNPVLWEIGA